MCFFACFGYSPARTKVIRFSVSEGSERDGDEAGAFSFFGSELDESAHDYDFVLGQEDEGEKIIVGGDGKASSGVQGQAKDSLWRASLDWLFGQKESKRQPLIDADSDFDPQEVGYFSSMNCN